MRAVPDAELWVVGERLDSDRGADMAALLRNAGLGYRLRMLGYREDIPALLAAADIFTLPSRFEGLPMSVIEAMLTGLPVVATRRPRPSANRSWMARPGCWCRPRQRAGLGAALARLVADPALRRAMGEAGRARALELLSTRRKSPRPHPGPAADSSPRYRAAAPPRSYADQP